MQQSLGYPNHLEYVALKRKVKHTSTIATENLQQLYPFAGNFTDAGQPNYTVYPQNRLSGRE